MKKKETKSNKCMKNIKSCRHKKEEEEEMRSDKLKRTGKNFFRRRGKGNDKKEGEKIVGEEIKEEKMKCRKE